jgi:hypothetical protein
MQQKMTSENENKMLGNNIEIWKNTEEVKDEEALPSNRNA